MRVAFMSSAISFNGLACRMRLPSIARRGSVILTPPAADGGFRFRSDLFSYSGRLQIAEPVDQMLQAVLLAVDDQRLLVALHRMKKEHDPQAQHQRDQGAIERNRQM